MDSVLAIDPDLVTEAVKTLALSTVTAFRNGVSMKWNEAELGVYMIYIFGEINKCKHRDFSFESFSLFGRSWRKGAVSFLSCSSNNGPGSAQGYRFLTVSFDNTRRALIGFDRVWNVCIPKSGRCPSVLRDCFAIYGLL
jgi:hypothetical protein